jgi:hypothetical protein
MFTSITSWAACLSAGGWRRITAALAAVTGGVLAWATAVPAASAAIGLAAGPPPSPDDTPAGHRQGPDHGTVRALPGMHGKPHLRTVPAPEHPDLRPPEDTRQGRAATHKAVQARCRSERRAGGALPSGPQVCSRAVTV